MAKDRLPVGKEGQTAAPMGGAAPAGPGTARPAIVIVERGPGEYETSTRSCPNAMAWTTGSSDATSQPRPEPW